MPELHAFTTEAELSAFGATFVKTLSAGDIVLLSGPLGAGKTTLARAMIGALGWDGHVRSPTYNLIHTYDTKPPVMHADLYRLQSAAGLGLEEFLDSHLCLIEWPDRLGNTLSSRAVIEVEIAFAEIGRHVRVNK